MAKAKPKYRLQPVFDKREREKDAAVKKVKDAEKRVEFEKKKLVKLKEMRAQIDVRKQALTDQFLALLDKAEPGVQIAEESLMHDRYQVILDQEATQHDQAIVQQQGKIRAAELAVKAAEKELIQAMVNVQAMEKHRDEWAKEVKKEEQRKEQEIQEELGEVMWLQQRRRKRLREQGEG
jgi:hypothetical protein